MPSSEVLEANFQNMKETIEENKKQNAAEHIEIKVMMKEGFNNILAQIKDISDNKANKWVENGIKFIYVTAGVSFIGLLIRWIINLKLDK
jgi:uncharacterized ferredoxin-like protein